jgi:hypothetical protein
MADPARLRGSLSQRSRLRGKLSHYALCGCVDGQDRASLNTMKKPKGFALRQPILDGKLSNDLACHTQLLGFDLVNNKGDYQAGLRAVVDF